MRRENPTPGGRGEPRIRLASNLLGRLSTGGLISSTSPLNQFGKNVGVAIPLNGNPEELLFLGEIRGT
jgi:hypothetical protein